MPTHPPSHLTEPAGGWAELLDSLNAIIWEADPATFQFRYVSVGAEAILGYPQARWISEPGFWVEIIHPDDRDEAVAFCRSRVDEGVDHEFEYRAIRADGGVVWLRDLVRVISDSDGNPISLRGTMVDISAAKALQERLEDEKARYRLLADNILDMVSLHDAKGRFLYASPAAKHILGYTPEELVGRALSEVIHPEDLPTFDAAIERELGGALDQPSIVFRAVTREGDIRWLETKGGVAHRGDSPEETRLVGVTRDFSEQKLLQDELNRAQRLEALGRLAGGIAHDFNNLLTVIRGHLDLVRDGLPGGVAQEFGRDLDEMDHAVRQAGALTRQLLTFGRRDIPRPREIDLGEVVSGLAGMLRRLLPESVELREELHPASLPIRMDPAQLEQILMNLVVNARDAMPAGGVISLATGLVEVGRSTAAGEPGLSPGSYATLEVRDTGVGMGPEVRSRIFEPFFTTKGASQGTGLGLAIVYGIVRQGGGHIRVESSPRGGTTFRLLLPVREEAFSAREGLGNGDSPSADRSSAPVPGETQLPTPPGPIGGRILLVEEETPVRNVIRSYLVGDGLEVLAAGSLEEALAAQLRSDLVPDLLITPSVLARGYGADLAYRLRSDHPDLPVIYIVDGGEGEDGVRFEGPGTWSLARPVTRENLARAIRHVLG